MGVVPDVNAVDNKGYNALHYAAKHNNLELVKYLCEVDHHLQPQPCSNDLSPKPPTLSLNPSSKALTLTN